MFLGNNGPDVYIALDRKSTIEGQPGRRSKLEGSLDFGPQGELAALQQVLQLGQVLGGPSISIDSWSIK